MNSGRSLRGRCNFAPRLREQKAQTEVLASTPGAQRVAAGHWKQSPAVPGTPRPAPDADQILHPAVVRPPLRRECLRRVVQDAPALKRAKGQNEKFAQHDG